MGKNNFYSRISIFSLKTFIISIMVSLSLLGFRFIKGSGSPDSDRWASLSNRKLNIDGLKLSPLKSNYNNQKNKNDIDSDWLSTVQSSITKQEYNITYDDKVKMYQSPNRKNNLRIYYYKNGFKVQPRQTKIPLFDLKNSELPAKERRYKNIPNWNINISLEGFGKNEMLNKFNGEGFNVSNNSAFIEDEDMRIEYVNDESGMRQNFLVKNKHVGVKNLNLIFQIKSGLKYKINKNIINFLDKKNNNIISYYDLKVKDANGKILNSNFQDNGNKSYSIIVDDNEAVYPIEIDPLSSTPNWTAESDQSNANFGYSVSVAGDVNGGGYSDVIVGAPFYDNGESNEGKVFVYYGSNSGLSSTANWTKEINIAEAWFGISVSTAGDVNNDGYCDVVIGASNATNDQSNEGMVYIFLGSATGLNSTPSQILESNQSNSYFGHSVSVAGDVNGDGRCDIIVGAKYFDNGQTNEGKVYVYYGTSSGVSTTPNWTYESNQDNAELGLCVSTAGDVNGDGYSDIIVGAPYYDNGQSDEGVALIFHGSSSGLPGSPNRTLEINHAGGIFGKSVFTAGDVNGDGYSDVIVGAPLYDGGQIDEGAVFVYYGSASGVQSSYAWMTESNQEYARYGWSVSSAGDINGDGYADVIAGAYWYDNGETDEGIVFLFLGSAAGLSGSYNQLLESNHAGAIFGCSVAPAGDVNGDGFSDVIIGAYLYDGGQTDEGRAYVFYGSAGTLSNNPNWLVESNQYGARLGESVSTAGDVNGDGYSDVIVGCPYFDGTYTEEGIVFVFYGSSSGLSWTYDWSARGNQIDAHFGFSVSTAGDVNGDGFSDVIIGADGYNNGELYEGGAFVYYGSSSGLSSTYNWSAESNQLHAHFGYYVSTAGDVNGDGFSDVIIGAPYFENGFIDEGSAFVYLGSSSGLSVNYNWTAKGNQTYANFGFSVSSAGDVNGDGYSDIIIGSPYYDGDYTNEGIAYVFYGSSSGLSSNYNWSAKGNQVNASFGIDVSTAGDVNGDGYSDIIVGAELYDNGETDEGAAFVFHGSSSGLSATTNWIGESNQVNSHYGTCVTTVGDVNGDGYSDIICGADNYSNPENREGKAFLYIGTSLGLSVAPSWTAEGNQISAEFAWDVSTAGDVNGDGYSDLIVGEHYYSNGSQSEGAAFVYYGNGGITGKRSTIQQYKPGTLNIICPNGLSGTNGGARLSLFGNSYLGRSSGRVQIEIKQNGQPFSGNPITNSTSSTYNGSYVDFGFNGSQLNYDASGITTNYEYKWRARLRYTRYDNPFQRLGPWRYYTSYTPIPWGCFKAQNSPLPVNLVLFNYNVNKNNVSLNWVTSNELNNSHFDIERKKTEENSIWNKIGSDPGIGNSQGIRYYTFSDNNLQTGKYNYRLKQVDLNGHYEYYYLNGIVSVGVPLRFSIGQNYPNPFNSETKIDYELPDNGNLKIELYDITGRKVSVISDEYRNAGYYTLKNNLSSLSSGVYFYIFKMENGKLTQTLNRKIIIIK